MFLGIAGIVILLTDTVSRLDRSTDMPYCSADIVILMTDTVFRLDRFTDMLFCLADIVILMTDTVSQVDRFTDRHVFRYSRHRNSDDRHRFLA